MTSAFTNLVCNDFTVERKPHNKGGDHLEELIVDGRIMLKGS
jgi:hypothetical protein